MMAKMERSGLPLSKLPQTTRLFADFLVNFSKVSEFYAYPPNEDGIAAAARKRCDAKTSTDTRQSVAEILRQQNLKFGADKSVARNLDRLRDDALAVVTGQQTALFGGPAYTVYKAVTAIHWADWLTGQGIAAVPVFWMATEDHDFEEVDHVAWPSLGRIPGGTAPDNWAADDVKRLDIRPLDAAKDGAVGNIPLGGEIENIVEIAATTMNGPRAAEIAAALRDAYRPDETVGGAFAMLMARLFAGRGLILLDPLDAGLHRMAVSILRGAVENADTLSAELIARGKMLDCAGYHSQVRITPQSTLLFRFVGGRREPIRRHGRDYAAGKMTFTHDELLAAVEKRPEDFSPNALLRPVVQDSLLPTAAYIGGPAEIAYFAQSSVIYRKLGVLMPAILPRAGFTLVDTRTARLLRKYKLRVEDLFAGSQRIRQRMEQDSLPKGLTRRFRIGEKSMARLLKALRSPLRRLDPTLLGALDTAQRKVLFQYAKLSVKAGRAEGFRNGVLERHERWLTDMLYPKKGLQERTLSALPFIAGQSGNLIDELLNVVHKKGTAEHHVETLR
jgi:bacillithiol biosynthesis cysteine-adding enzyme BshC